MLLYVKTQRERNFQYVFENLLDLIRHGCDSIWLSLEFDYQHMWMAFFHFDVSMQFITCLLKMQATTRPDVELSTDRSDAIFYILNLSLFSHWQCKK